MRIIGPSNFVRFQKTPIFLTPILAGQVETHETNASVVSKQLSTNMFFQRVNADHILTVYELPTKFALSHFLFPLTERLRTELRVPDRSC